jgi:amino acid transporter
MNEQPRPSRIARLKRILIGRARSPQDPHLFHKLSLIAFFAWIGLGSDGLSSSCYGPEEIFKALEGHEALAIFVGLGAALTILLISASYSQIIEAFPTGGGGYIVASRLLSPTLGLVSGCALLVDYVLTITISVASGADAIFSFLPQEWYPLRLGFAVFVVMGLILLNLRGVRESVVPLIPIFLLFLITHAFILTYGIGAHASDVSAVWKDTMAEVRVSHSELGLLGMIFLMLRAFSMGAGTFTGIEAVSNGLPILREPRVETGKRTMRYMAVSLAITVVGLLVVYLLYQVKPQPGKTLNAIAFERIMATWPETRGYVIVLLTLISEAVLLFVAAQTGFLDGPRVMSNMARDRRFPTRFAMLSDRFVIQNGVMLMGTGALILMLATGGSVHFLVVLYSINVFITFVLSQMGMVRHWWVSRAKVKDWLRKIFINGAGLAITAIILISVIIIKFDEGGWLTLLVTGALFVTLSLVKRHYDHTSQLLKRLEDLVVAADVFKGEAAPRGGRLVGQRPKFDSNSKTAVLFVNGYNGLGLHTLFGIIRLFGGSFRNFVFVQIGVIDAQVFKGSAEIENLQRNIERELEQYVSYVQRHGFYAAHFSSVGTDIIDEIMKIVPRIQEQFPNAVFFGGQLVFPEDVFFSRWLHNYTIFAIQRKFYHMGIPVIILPIRV